MAVEYLKQILGESNVAKDNSHSVSLPVFLKCYSFETLSLFDQRYVFVGASEKLNLKTYKAQKSKIEELFDCPAVLVLKQSNTQQRRNLIENRIMFIEEGKQLFMPSLGVVINDSRSNRPNTVVEKFTPQMQLCALFFLYSSSYYYTVKQIVEKTQLNEMAISRGLSVLEKIEAISHDSKGRTNYYFISIDKKTYLKKIEDLSISPIWKRFLINKKHLPKDCYRAGYSALSEYSMISDGETPTYAISKEQYKKIQDKCEIAFEDLLYGAEYVNLEVWKYAPSIFENVDAVDKFSLYLSFDKNNVDERTEEAIEELKESIYNG